MTGKRLHADKKFRVRRKLKLRNRNNHKRIYMHVSNKHLNAQLINDVTGNTMITVTTVGKEGNNKKNCSNIKEAKNLANELVAIMNEKKYKLDEAYVFDRGDKIYHGKVAAFVEELREKGVKV
ncbi:MAG: 50S ribosomal protein L18 [Spirochaetia bacterium]|nr:50S ribosomal protein L18 [Spirochaetia bacterium]